MGHIDELFPELAKEVRTLSSAGILPSQKIRELIKEGQILSAKEMSEEQIQPASIDLRLGAIAYRVRASFLPGPNSTVVRKIESLIMSELDLTRSAVLERGCVYVIPLLESLALSHRTAGIGNPRSSIGRLDIFTRLITDYGKEFERIAAGYRGPLYAEVVPRTFSVLVREGMRLSQLRFTQGSASTADTRLAKLNKEEPLVFADDDRPMRAQISGGLLVSVDLQNGSPARIVGYRAKKNAPVIDLSKVDYYEPDEFWEHVPRPASKGVILNPGDFYILGSKEKIRIPPNFAAEMVAFDPSLGEFRIHYAGFFDPGFGHGGEDIKGTPAVLEVRAHEVPFVIEDGQVVGRLIYSRLTEIPDKIYGPLIGSAYQFQRLALSKQFKKAPS